MFFLKYLLLVLSSIGAPTIGFLSFSSFTFNLLSLRSLRFSTDSIISFAVVFFLVVNIFSFLNFFFIFVGYNFGYVELKASFFSFGLSLFPLLLFYSNSIFSISQLMRVLTISVILLCFFVFVNLVLLYMRGESVLLIRHVDSYIVSGWPTRIIPLIAIVYFYNLSFLLFGRFRYSNFFFFSLALLLILLSGTRSSIFTILIISALSLVRFNFLFFLFLVVFLAPLVAFSDLLGALLRIAELWDIFLAFGTHSIQLFNPESSLGYRFYSIWPLILENLQDHIFLGWGHLGVSHLPISAFSEWEYVTRGAASAESQYFDLLQRTGIFGLVSYVVLLGALFFKSLSIFRSATGIKRNWFFTFLCFFALIFFHGLTTEVTRFYPLSIILYMIANFVHKESVRKA